jgi:hypothetical protein
MADPKTREITLPSGRKALIREGFGRDLMRAQKVARSMDEIPMALVAQLVEMDGKPISVRGPARYEFAGCARAAGPGDVGKFRFPSAADFAGLVQFGFLADELERMSFERLTYWLEAVQEHQEAVNKEIARARGG